MARPGGCCHAAFYKLIFFIVFYQVRLGQVTLARIGSGYIRPD